MLSSAPPRRIRRLFKKIRPWLLLFLKPTCYIPWLPAVSDHFQEWREPNTSGHGVELLETDKGERSMEATLKKNFNSSRDIFWAIRNCRQNNKIYSFPPLMDRSVTFSINCLSDDVLCGLFAKWLPVLYNLMWSNGWWSNTSPCIVFHSALFLSFPPHLAGLG